MAGARSCLDGKAFRVPHPLRASKGAGLKASTAEGMGIANTKTRTAPQKSSPEKGPRTADPGSPDTTCRRKAETLIFPGCTGPNYRALEASRLFEAIYYASQDLGGAGDNATRYKHIDDPKVRKGYHHLLLIAAANANLFGDTVLSSANPLGVRMRKLNSVAERAIISMTLLMASRAEGDQIFLSVVTELAPLLNVMDL
jgi:hypothetical protein